MKSEQLTDRAWASLRRATPAFRGWWRRYKDATYDPTIPYVGISELARYVALAFRSREPVGRLRPLFTAVERLLRRGSPGVQALVTIGFLERLMSEEEEESFDLRRVYSMLGGDRSRDAWRRAAAWVAPDARWHGQRGFVRTLRHPELAGVVVAFASRFDDPKRVLRLFALVTSGAIRPGWFIEHRIGAYHFAAQRVAETRPYHRPGWPPLVELSLAWTSDRERSYLTIFDMAVSDPVPFMVYRRAGRSVR